MARVLLFVVLVFLAWLAVKSLLGGRRCDGAAARVGEEPQRAPEPIAQCAWCGVHAPATTALSLPDGRVYCSEAHREQARLTGTPADRSAR